jgi:hypothetical protein
MQQCSITRAWTEWSGTSLTAYESDSVFLSFSKGGSLSATGDCKSGHETACRRNLQTPKNIYLAHTPKEYQKSFRVRVQSSDDVHEMPIRRLIRVLIRNASPKKNTKRKKERKQQVCSNFASTASLCAQFQFRDILRKHRGFQKKHPQGFIPYTVKLNNNNNNNNNIICYSSFNARLDTAQKYIP